MSGHLIKSGSSACQIGKGEQQKMGEEKGSVRSEDDNMEKEEKERKKKKDKKKKSYLYLSVICCWDNKALVWFE